MQALQEGVPLPVGMVELTEPWLSPPPDLEEARRLVLATGAEPAAPLSLGVSAALELAARSLPTVLGAAQEAAEPMHEAGEGAGVPQPFYDAVATVPHSMQDVMQLAVPEPRAPEPVGEDSTLRNPGAALDSRTEEDSSTSLEIIGCC